MNAFRFWRIASRPCQSATPRLQTASSVKQSKPLPKVLSSISFQNANSHSGGAVFVKGTVFSFVVMLTLLGLKWIADRRRIDTLKSVLSEAAGRSGVRGQIVERRLHASHHPL